MRRVRRNENFNDVYKNIIYAICDPETGDPFYVGQSSTGINRPLSHTRIKSHNDAINIFIKELNSKNQSPIIIVLESTNQETLLNDKEKYWINKYIELGYPLLNKTNININNKNSGITLKTQLSEIGKFARENRRYKKLTQKELGDKINVERACIGKIENGEHNYTINNIIKILNYFNSKLIITDIDNAK